MTWLTTGKNFKAQQALADHVIDGVLTGAADKYVNQAIDLLSSANAGDLDWQSKQTEKHNELTMNGYELAMSVNVARGMVAKAAGPHYPAPNFILDT
ncbi:hypothetical protein [Vibrio aestuarianus]|uniref:hypothetical protein n=1 Tax=Vibrio aestuarianus TaxID=28171 RepID=UPI0020B15AC6|nr:hypothetical protein [Vibrio aestuarianus]